MARPNRNSVGVEHALSSHAKPPSVVETAKGPRLLIGVVERVDFPDWGVMGLKAKIDTGARSSALHVDAIEKIDAHRIRFSIPQSSGANQWVTATFSRQAKVRSSSGVEQSRFFVMTELHLGAHQTEIEISLTSRDAMRYPMLLGRTAMKGLAIDPARRFVATQLNSPRKPSLRKKKKTATNNG